MEMEIISFWHLFVRCNGHMNRSTCARKKIFLGSCVRIGNLIRVAQTIRINEMRELRITFRQSFSIKFVSPSG